MKKIIIFSLMLISCLIFTGIYLKNEKEKIKPIVIQEVCPINYDYIGEFEITYYVATGNRTSTGVYPKSDRTIAVDPKVIPYGSIVYIEGVGARIAEDCGSAVKNNVIDVFVDVTQDEALKMGRKKAKVYLIGE